MRDEINPYASDTQLILARLYRAASAIGFILIAGTFLLYVSGFIQVRVPAQEVALYWHLDAGAYAETTGTAVGWAFLRELSSGESLSFGSLVCMALAVIICLMIMVMVFLRKRKHAFALIALLQTAVLLIAATGIASG